MLVCIPCKSQCFQPHLCPARSTIGSSKAIEVRSLHRSTGSTSFEATWWNDSLWQLSTVEFSVWRLIFAVPVDMDQGPNPLKLHMCWANARSRVGIGDGRVKWILHDPPETTWFITGRLYTIYLLHTFYDSWLYHTIFICCKIYPCPSQLLLPTEHYGSLHLHCHVPAEHFWNDFPRSSEFECPPTHFDGSFKWGRPGETWRRRGARRTSCWGECRVGGCIEGRNWAGR